MRTCTFSSGRPTVPSLCDIGVPLCQFAPQWGAARDKRFDAAAHAGANFRIDQAVGDPPGRCARRLTSYGFWAMAAPHGKSAAIDPFLRDFVCLLIHLSVNFL